MIDDKCPSCGNYGGVSHETVEREFPYGLAPKEVILSAKVLEATCDICSFTWTDSNAESARGESVVRYLQQRVSDLEKQLASEVPLEGTPNS